MVEVEKLCKKILFIINLRRIKQITRDKCSSKGGGVATPSTPPLDPPLLTELNIVVVVVVDVFVN